MEALGVIRHASTRANIFLLDLSFIFAQLVKIQSFEKTLNDSDLETDDSYEYKEEDELDEDMNEY